jgi:hypothetical protein
MLSAEYNLDESGKLDAGILGFLTAGLDVTRLEKIRVELTTSSKASVTVPSDCPDPVVYDAIAGSLEVRYYAKQGASVGATTSSLATSGLSAGGSYHVDEERRVASVTLAPDLFVAYRVHDRSAAIAAEAAAEAAAEEHHASAGNVTGKALFVTGLALFLLGYASDSDCWDTGYGRHCEPTAAQIGGITVGTIVGISGIVTWGVSR